MKEPSGLGTRLGRSDLQILPTSSQRGSVLIWGALGFIGFHLTEALIAAGFDVSVLCRSKGSYPEPRWRSQVHWHELDSARADKVLDEAVASSSIIFDLAGSSGAAASNANPIESLEKNCHAQLEFLQACRRAKHKPHVVFSSSRLVYGETPKSFVSEDHPVSPRSVYAAHKLCIEQYLQVYTSLGAISHTVCRISNAYGPDPGRAGQGYKILNSFITKCLAGLPITLFGSGRQVRDFIYIHDLTDVLIRCGIMPNARNQIFNIGSGKGCRLVDAANLIRTATGGPPLIFEPWPKEYLAVESGDYISDIGKTSRLLGFAPKYSMSEGILDTVRAYQQELGKPLVDSSLPLVLAGEHAAVGI